MITGKDTALPHFDLAIKAPEGAYHLFGKRVLDLSLVLLGLPVLIPVAAALVLGLLMSGSKPFFAHNRVGLDGRTFRCWKFRTMVPDAEAQLQKVLENDPVAANEWQIRQKISNDPRVTRLGRILRATGLDELPQIWNVVRGDMSLVGPRPVTATEVSLMGPLGHAYQNVRPGITGHWQVHGRGLVTTQERIHMEIDYMRTLSIARDLKLIFLTFGAIIARPGE